MADPSHEDCQEVQKLTALAKYSTKPVSSVLKARTTHNKQELFINDPSQRQTLAK
jgi:hypothetical protein